jgi:hypothetical protein
LRTSSSFGELFRRFRQPVFDVDVLAFDVAKFVKSLLKALQERLRDWPVAQEAYSIDGSDLPRLKSNRPHACASEYKKLTPPHTKPPQAGRGYGEEYGSTEPFRIRRAALAELHGNGPPLRLRALVYVPPRLGRRGMASERPDAGLPLSVSPFAQEMAPVRQGRGPSVYRLGDVGI